MSIEMTGLYYYGEDLVSVLILNMIEQLSHEQGISIVMNTHYPTNPEHCTGLDSIRQKSRNTASFMPELLVIPYLDRRRTVHSPK